MKKDLINHNGGGDMEIAFDDDMAIAQQLAIESLPGFLDMFLNSEDDGLEFFIKGIIRNDDCSISESIWVSLSGFDDGWFYGKLDSMPCALQEYKLGDNVEICRCCAFVDWAVYRGNQIIAGAFSYIAKAKRDN
jgi:uncharacterized protein YegJ (DUF2314 family)